MSHNLKVAESVSTVSQPNSLKLTKYLPLNFSFALSTLLCSLSVSSLFVPSVGAAQIQSRIGGAGTNVVQTETLPNSRPIEIALSTCPSRQSIVDRRFDTRDYYVYICSGDRYNSLGYYVGISKNGRGSITVPLSRRSGDRYVAINRNTTYVVNPSALVVTQNRRVILRQSVLRAYAY